MAFVKNISVEKFDVASKDKSRVIEVAVFLKLTKCYEFVTISSTISSFKEGAVPARQWMWILGACFYKE